MTIAGLAYMNACLNELDIPYEFMEWTSDSVPDTYWIAEYVEIESMNEDGLQETSFILTGTTKGKFLELEQTKSKIFNYFEPEGLTTILENGWGIAVMYESAYPVPSVDIGVHRLQITLRIKEWKGE